MSTFINKARESGYSDEEIYSHLSKDKKYAPFLKSGKSNGYGEKELIDHLSKGSEESEEKQKKKDVEYRRSIGHITPEERKEMVAPYGLASTIKEHLPQAAASIPANALQFAEMVGTDPHHAVARMMEGASPFSTPLTQAFEEATGIAELPEEHKENLDLMNMVLGFMGVGPEALARMGPAAKNYVRSIASKLRKSGGPGVPPGGGGGPGKPPEFQPGRAEVFENTTASQPEMMAEKLAEEAIGQPPKSAFDIAEQHLLETQPVKPGGKSFGLRISVMPKEGGKSLAGRANLPGSSISPYTFESNTAGGMGIARRTLEGARRERQVVREAYNRARQRNVNVNGIFPRTANELQNTINLLIEAFQPSPAQTTLANRLEDILVNLGGHGGYIESPVQRMIAQSDSLTSMANFDIEFSGVKDHLKRLGRVINEEAIQAIERSGGDSSLLREADQRFGRWADRYQNDEIAPYIKRRIRNPEDLLKKSINDEATFRAVSDALRGTPQGNEYVDALARKIAEKRMNKFIKSGDVGTPEYEAEIRNLQDLMKRFANKPGFQGRISKKLKWIR